MRALGTVVATLAALLWSGLVWGTYAVVVVSSGFLARNAGWHDLPAEAIGWASMLDGFLRDYGAGLAAAIWAIGLLVIFALRAIYNALLGLGRTEREPPPEQRSSFDRAVAEPRQDAPPPADPIQWGRGPRSTSNVP